MPPKRKNQFPKTSSPLLCWVVAPDRPGTLNQALGLAQAMAQAMDQAMAQAMDRPADLRIEIRTIEIPPLWQRIPTALWPDPFGLLVHKSLTTDAPREKRPLTQEDGCNSAPHIWPDIWIATGRQSVPFTIAAKRRAPHLWTVQTQDPKAPSSYFDVVVPPTHDGVTGENILPMIGAPTILTAQGIENAAQKLRKAYDLRGKKTIAALIGGPNKQFNMSETVTDHLISKLKALITDDYALLITTSRRTPDHMISALKSLETAPNVRLHIAGGTDMQPNPYPGILGLADTLMVTEDSVNMLMEASLTGKPVYTLPLEGSPGKFSILHKSLQERGITRPFTGLIEDWKYQPFNETDRVARELVQRWQARELLEHA